MFVLFEFVSTTRDVMCWTLLSCRLYKMQNVQNETFQGQDAHTVTWMDTT